MLLLCSLSMYSQSYPIQRVEGSDTLVIMTKAQAMAMNKKFMRMDSTIKSGNTIKKMLKASVAEKDSAIYEVNKQLMKKPQYMPVTKTDVFMSAYFVLFSTIIFTLTF